MCSTDTPSLTSKAALRQGNYNLGSTCLRSRVLPRLLSDILSTIPSRCRMIQRAFISGQTALECRGRRRSRPAGLYYYPL